jgi:hypothetical protein
LPWQFAPLYDGLLKKKLQEDWADQTKRSTFSGKGLEQAQDSAARCNYPAWGLDQNPRTNISGPSLATQLISAVV